MFPQKNVVKLGSEVASGAILIIKKRLSRLVILDSVASDFKFCVYELISVHMYQPGKNTFNVWSTKN